MQNNHIRKICFQIGKLLFVFFLITSISISIQGCGREESDEPDKPTVFEPPVEPENAVETMKLADKDLKVELFAAEPMVIDPVAMEIDEYGRIYVVEMPGYPLDVEGSGRVKLLQDTNGDGFPDQSTVFAEGLVLPKGIMRWRQGILITDAPDLVYLEDSTGDGKADIKEVMLTGFARTNPQHNFNKPLYGLDNWIYLANSRTTSTELFPELFGDQGSEVRFSNDPDGTVLPQNANGRNVRFRPDSGELEMLSSWSQFGHDFDTWGRHFLISNADHHFHEAIAARYVDRNPDFPVHESIHHTPVHGNAAEVYPITLNPEHQMLTDIGVMTSASSITWYLGGAFGEKYENVTFVAESVHNLVHADKVVENGSAFEARRLFEEKEFLASTDYWFRPVNFYIGPDGALYVLDYYRHVIEHPQWMDDEAVEQLDLYAGKDRGRIYRISRSESDGADWINNLDLGEASTEELVAYLENENIWWRRNAQRLLVDRQPASAVEPLSRLLSQCPMAAARVHALWTLQGLGALEPDQIRQGLDEEHAGIRENAIRLAELHMEDNPELLDYLLALEEDSSTRVRYQLLLTLGFFDAEDIRQVRKQLLFDDIEDNWFQVAALTSPSARDTDMLGQTIAELGDEQTPGRRNYFRHVGAMIAAGGNRGEMRDLIRKTAGNLGADRQWWQSAVLEGFSAQINRSRLDVDFLQSEREALLDGFFQSEYPEFRPVALQMLKITGLPDGREGQSVMEKAESITVDTEADENFRADALRLIGIGGADAYKQMLFDLVHHSVPAVVQQASLQVLVDVPGEDVAEFVLNRWPEFTPQFRDQAVNVLMTNRNRRSLLLDAVEQNRIHVSTIGWNQRVALMRHSGGDEYDAAMRDRARALFSRDPDSHREIIERYQTAISEKQGDRSRGRQVFMTSCSVCHQAEGEGVAFGPDTGTFRHWSSRALLTKILDPSRSIADGYEMWLVQRHNRSPVSGVMVSETAGSVTLRDPAGIETTIPRSDIETISASNASAMPEGLEHQIGEQEMADLIAYIRSSGL